MSSFESATIEPRKIFLGWLIHEMGFAVTLLYHDNRCFRGLQAMRGLIDNLDTQSQKLLGQERMDIESMLATNKYTKQEVYSLYSRIAQYLHRSYLQEVSMGLIPTATLEGKETPPSHDKVASRLSAKLE